MKIYIFLFVFINVIVFLFVFLKRLYINTKFQPFDYDKSNEHIIFEYGNNAHLFPIRYLYTNNKPLPCIIRIKDKTNPNKYIKKSVKLKTVYHDDLLGRPTSRQRYRREILSLVVISNKSCINPSIIDSWKPKYLLWYELCNISLKYKGWRYLKYYSFWKNGEQVA